MYPREYFDTYWRPTLRDEVFVAMSFAECFNNAWTKIMRPAIDEQLADLNLKAHRVDTTKISSSILTEIMDGIANTRFILADISVESNGYRNANVLYEVGLAHALRQPEEVLLVRQDNVPIAFDVASVRIHNYDPDDADGSRDLIASLIRACLQEIDLRKGLKVQQAVESLDDECLRLLASHKDHGWFSVGGEKTMGQLVTTITKRLAVFKLLELGIIRADTNMQTVQHAYRWTPFGRIVLERLRFGASVHAEGEGTG